MYEKLTAKKALLDEKRPLPGAHEKNLLEWIRCELTFTSNALEGNTITRHETALILEKGIVAANKTLREHYEVTNHAKAFDFIQTLPEISQSTILKIHEMILKNIDDHDAGRYRDVQVRILGANVIFPNPMKVPILMDELLQKYTRNQNLHPVERGALIHYDLVTIHPFIDGNRRTARLLMNLILLHHGYPPRHYS